ncbi:ABC transporter permease [Sulfuricella sp.]|uniref:MlaE family ABC transporter permease n=1 Tax=Sulfuricella sp. TaxID=2099377 RepID=UPI002B8EE854|nr:ABC transporter permease [Sulfuricella sp.]HUX65180.1 ABC transporter permease [Sulfuricella sp.]
MNNVPANKQQVSAAPSPPTVVVSGDGDRLALAGALEIVTLLEARNFLKKWSRKGPSHVLDISGIDSLDTPGALFLCGLRDKGVELTGIRAEHLALLDLICGLDLKPLPKVESVPQWRQIIIQLGKGAHDARHEALDVITFVGRAASWTLNALMHPHCLRPAAISRHVTETGIHALPIIGLMAIMIAVVIGYQGVAQLRPYGGEDLTIDLVAVSVLREMGVLITAIMVAGRSGSAFTAEIGVMQTREEVDALKVMGIEPMQVLVVPRVIALVITLPLLTFFADILGLIGGAAIAQFLLDVSPTQYLTRLPHVVDGSDLFVGLVKAPIFAFFIAIVGCMHGLRVSGSAESVGRETTRAVVKSIFLVLALDALFSILFELLGI